jgi:hypothetical protein
LKPILTLAYCFETSGGDGLRGLSSSWSTLRRWLIV